MRFYRVLFNSAPIDVRAGTARFELDNPHRRLELHEPPQAASLVLAATTQRMGPEQQG